MAIYGIVDNDREEHNKHSDEIKKTLYSTYKEKYGKNPGGATLNALDCVDDAFLGEWRKELNAKDAEMRDELNSLKKQAEETINSLQQVVKTTQGEGFKDDRVSDALRAYLTIVNMKFEYPEEELQNIKNASYFIWAVFAKDSADSSEVFETLNEDQEEE